jgi:hypothetical protein
LELVGEELCSGCGMYCQNNLNCVQVDLNCKEKSIYCPSDDDWCGFLLLCIQDVMLSGGSDAAIIPIGEPFLHPYVGSGSSFRCYVESLIDSGQVI